MLSKRARLVSDRHTLAVLGRTQLPPKQEDQTKGQRFDAMVDLVNRYDAGDMKPQTIAARQRAILVEEIRKIRPLLRSLVGLDLHADHSSHWPALIAAWKDSYERGTVH